MKTRLGPAYSFVWALINFMEAVVILATLGKWSPGWVMSYCAWTMRRTFAKKDLRARNN